MQYKKYIFEILYILLALTLDGQVSFHKNLQNLDPIYANTKLTFEEKLATHNQYLKKAQTEKNIDKTFYGLSFLFIDNLKTQNFSDAYKYILLMEKIAENNNLFLDAIYSFKAILNVYMNERDKAIGFYEQAAKYGRLAGDSLCVAESMEQLGALNGAKGNKQKAKQYFEIAIPMIEKYGGKEQKATSLNNIGNTHFSNKEFEDALLYFNQAVEMYKSIGEAKKYAQSLNNVGATYLELGEFSKADKTLKKCIEFNSLNKFNDNLITNYKALYELNVHVKDFTNAHHYFEIFHALEDSIRGEKVKLEIARLGTEVELNKHQLELKENQNLFLTAKSKYINTIIVFSLLSLILIALVIIYKIKVTYKTNEQKISQNALNDLAKLLREKNENLALLQDKLSKSSNYFIPQNERIENRVLEQRILTQNDWNAFKIYFDKSYPLYRTKLLNSFSGITEAEERLFLLIKLKLSSVDCAHILGISSESVKKTRQRLRKRIGLEAKEKLDLFIENFNKI